MAQLKLVELCYRYAYLNMKNSSGLELQEDEKRLLGLLQDMLEGDPNGQRRHRRFPLKLSAVVKTNEGLCRGMVLNLSGDGMLLALEKVVEVGDTIQVKVGSTGDVDYLFSTTVIRREQGRDVMLLGLSFNCVPLEMRRHPSGLHPQPAV